MAIINTVDYQKYSRVSLDVACRGRNAKFVAEINVPFAKVPSSGELAWTEYPCIVLHSEDMQKEGGHYVAIYQDPFNTKWVITACDEFAEGLEWYGAEADNGDVIWSKHKDDYRRSPDNSIWIQGGRKAWQSNGKKMLLKITNGTLNAFPVDSE